MAYCDNTNVNMKRSYIFLISFSPSIYYYNYNIFNSLMTLLMLAMGIINRGVSDCIYLQFHCKHNILSLCCVCM